MNKKRILTTVLAFTLGLTMTACGGKKDEVGVEKKDIKLVTMESSLPTLEKVKEVMEDKGYTVDINLVDMNVPVMESVQDKSADAGLGVHIKFMNKYNKDNNGQLFMPEPYAYYTGIGLYSNGFNDVKDIPNDARISIMHDAMNMDMALRMLRDYEVIELEEGHDGDYSVIDIKENPKNIEFVEVDQIQTIRMMDELDGAIAFFGHAKSAKMDPKSFVIRNKDGEDYPMGIFVRDENKDTQWAKDLAESFHDERVKGFVTTQFDGVFNYYEINK